MTDTHTINVPAMGRQWLRKSHHDLAHLRRSSLQSRINDREGRRSQQRRGEQNSKGMVEMERTECSDLRQESPNEIEDPDIPDGDSADVAVRLRSMVNIS